MKRLLHRTSVLLVLAACAAAPSDSFGRAQAALGRDDLLGALLAYDSVPVMHVRYPARPM